MVPAWKMSEGQIRDHRWECLLKAVEKGEDRIKKYEERIEGYKDQLDKYRQKKLEKQRLKMQLSEMRLKAHVDRAKRAKQLQE